jgi:hypothetical protein
MIDQAVERFERQLTHQIVGFRDDIREGEAALHTELRVLEASLRKDLSAARDEGRQAQASLHIELRDIGASGVTAVATLRKEIADQRRELRRWLFALWLGQLVGFGALATLLH